MMKNQMVECFTISSDLLRPTEATKAVVGEIQVIEECMKVK